MNDLVPTRSDIDAPRPAAPFLGLTRQNSRSDDRIIPPGHGGARSSALT
jgi:hypothetical protein